MSTKLQENLLAEYTGAPEIIRSLVFFVAHGDYDSECRAVMEGTLGAYRTMMEVDKLFADGQTDPGARDFGGIGAAVKLCENEIDIRLRYTNAGVFNSECKRLLLGYIGKRYIDRRSSMREFYGIRQQTAADIMQDIGIAVDDEILFGHMHIERDFLILCNAADIIY